MSYSSWRPPFPYSGGKSQIASEIFRLLNHHFPAETHLLSPFLGAGAVELRFMHAKKDGSCHAADSEQPLINFWHHAQVHAPYIADLAESYLPVTPEEWQSWYHDIRSNAWRDPDTAARDWIMRHTKVVHAWELWKGLLERFNAPKKHGPALSRLRHFKVPRLTVEHADFREFLSAHDGVCYVDPPYYSERGEMERVYADKAETNVFSPADHEDLADILCKRKGWILSNHDCEWVRNRYKDYPQTPMKVRYSSRQMHESMDAVGKELLIVSR